MVDDGICLASCAKSSADWRGYAVEGRLQNLARIRAQHAEYTLAKFTTLASLTDCFKFARRQVSDDGFNDAFVPAVQGS